MKNYTPAELNLTKPAYRVSEFVKLSPLGKTATYADIKKGLLRVRKHGTATIILAPDGAAYLSNLAEKSLAKKN